MQKLKSLFITAWLLAVFAGCVRAGYAIMQQHTNYQWWLVLVALGSVSSFFTWLFVAKVARTKKFSFTVFGINLLITIGMVATNQSNTEAFVWIIFIGLIGSALYEWWYSSFGFRNSNILKIGGILPNLEFQDTHGKTFTTQECDKTLLLLFFRGNWCPLCMAQIREIAALYQELHALGVEICLIGRQSQNHTIELAKQFDVPMTFLTDPLGKMSNLLGISIKHGVPSGLNALGYDSDTVMPTVLIVDGTKKILYCDLTSNYRIRPEPEEFLRLLKTSIK